MPTLLASLLALLWLPQSGPEITVETLGADGYRLSVTVEGVTDPLVAQRLLVPKAAALCGEEGYVFGRYRFEGTTTSPGQNPGQNPDQAPDRPATVTLRQDVSCGAASAPPPATVAPTRVPASEAEAREMGDRVTVLSERFFDAVEAGRDEEAFNMTAPETTGASLPDWSTRLAALRDAAGAPVSRQIARVTVYTDPPGVPAGLYVAIDYVASWEKQDECGYLVWRSDKPEGPFLLTRQEHSFFPTTCPPTSARPCAGSTA